METVVNIIVPAVVTILAGFAVYWYLDKNKRKVPKKWEPVGTVTKLFLYPLKSGRRMELDHAICTKNGLVMPKSESKYQFKDRNIICYKEKNLEYCSYPKMQLVEVSAMDENHFILSAPETPSLRVKIPNAIQDEKKKGKIFSWSKENIKDYDCGDDAAKWISLYVTDKESGLRLGFLDNNFRKNIPEKYKKSWKFYPNLNSDSAEIFNNESRYMIVNQASVDDISSKLPDENVTVNNFRPNILVHDKNLLPFVEDHWKWIKMGNVILYSVKPCLRCSVVSVNPETGIKSPKQEPLRTLRQYRKLRDVLNIANEGYSVVFGNQMDLEHEGHIKIGDTVFVEQ